MGKSLVSQVKAVWAASRILQPGRSRFQDKVAARDQFHREGVGATSARIADHTPITSYRTYDAYKSVTLEFAKFAKRLGVRQVRDLRPEHAEAFILSKLEEGRSCNTLRTYSAALGKFDCALERAPKAMRIPDAARLSPGIEAVRRDFNHEAPRLDTTRRAYSAPATVVQAVKGEGHRIAARLQLGAGFRVSEVLGLNRTSLRGETLDRVTRRWSGLLRIAGKGGHERTQYVPIQTYRDLERRLDENSGCVGVVGQIIGHTPKFLLATFPPLPAFRRHCFGCSFNLMVRSKRGTGRRTGQPAYAEAVGNTSWSRCTDSEEERLLVGWRRGRAWSLAVL